MLNVLQNEGGNVAIVDVLEEAGQKTTAEIAEKYGVKTAFYKCDVGIKAEVDMTIDQVVEDFGHIDVLVSNAGIQRRGDFLILPKKSLMTSFELT